MYPKKIVTTIEKAPFYPAEAYHQDFLVRNPNHPYILIMTCRRCAILGRCSLVFIGPSLYWCHQGRPRAGVGEQHISEDRFAPLFPTNCPYR